MSQCLRIIHFNQDMLILNAGITSLSLNHANQYDFHQLLFSKRLKHQHLSPVSDPWLLIDHTVAF